MINRRHLLSLLPAAAAGLSPALRAQGRLFPGKPKPRPQAPHPYVFFGTDTAKGDAKGIYMARFDPANGHFSPPTLAVQTMRPVYLALNQMRDRRVVYATNEGDEHTSAVSTFLLDANGGLRQTGQVSAGGAGPCYVAVDGTGRSAYVANYMGGSVASFKVKPDGTLTPPVNVVDFRKNKAFGDHGPVADRQDGPHPHSAMMSPDNRFLIVNDLGNDDIVLFPVDTETAKLGTPHVSDSRVDGSGPRHLAFHPNGRWAYGIDELSSKINQFLWNETHGSAGMESQAILTDAGHTVSTLDPGFHGKNTAAEIVVAPNGFFVYASNRGEDSLVVFTVNEANGNLTLAQRISCGGKTPRHFTLDPTGNWLVCGNQDSATVTVFARDAGTGRLSGPVQTMPLESPMFTLFV